MIVPMQAMGKRRIGARLRRSEGVLALQAS